MALLEDAEGIALFRHYLKAKLSSEVLDLYIDIQLFKHQSLLSINKGEILALAQCILDKYLKDGEGNEANIDEEVRAGVRENVMKGTVDQHTFDEVEMECLDLLCMDCFMGFRHTESYAKYTAKKGHPMRSSSASLTDYMKKHIFTHKRAHSDSQRNMRLYFDILKQEKSLRKKKE